MKANKRIKILHLITGLDTGGAEVSLQRLTNGMDRDQFENVVVSLTGPGPLTTVIRDQGIRVEVINMSRALPSPAALWRLYRLLRVEQPDILQTWLYHSDFFGLFAGWAARVPKISWNIRCSNMGEEYRNGINGALLRLLVWLSRYPDTIVANSYAGLEEHIALGYHANNWTVLQNGFDLDVFKPDSTARTFLRQELGLPTDAFLVGLIARYDPMKDHSNFLTAAADLHATDPDVHFVLAGAGIDLKNDDLSNLVDQFGIRHRVHLMGRRSDVPRLNAALDVATCCSLGEGFPNIVGEAMACATPCVVTDVGDAAQIVGDTGIIVPPVDSKALATGWRDMISKGPEGRASLGMRARLRIKSEYSLARSVERYQEFYTELTATAAP